MILKKTRRSKTPKNQMIKINKTTKIRNKMMIRRMIIKRQRQK